MKLKYTSRTQTVASEMLLLDTAPLVEFLTGLSSALKPILEQAESAGAAPAESAATIAELFFILARFKRADFARGFLRDFGFDLETIPVDAAIAEEAGSLKQPLGISRALRPSRHLHASPSGRRAGTTGPARGQCLLPRKTNIT